jgi:hypothetical protein
MGVTGFPDNLTSSELEDLALRVKSSEELREYGVIYSWDSHSLWEIQAQLDRAKKIRALEKAGVERPWSKLTLEEMIDIENRIKQAERVSKLGRAVDWEKHSLPALKKMEIDYYRLRRLRNPVVTE